MTAAEETYARPIVSVDLVILALSEAGIDVLLMERGSEPFAGEWALPGGWIHVDEDADLETAARRVLREKTGVETPYLEQLQTFGDAARDPRGWSLSVAYVALISTDEVELRRGANAADVAWSPVAGEAVALPLAFDHAEILVNALTRLRNKVEYSTLPVHLLPAAFTLGELQSVYERILGRPLDKSAFRKRVAEASFAEPIPGAMRRASNRPAQLYRLKQARLDHLLRPDDLNHWARTVMLDDLKANNRAWAARMVAIDAGFFKRLERQQAPEYLWIGCSDSRVPANEIVGLDPGELFVHRNVANLAPPQDANYLSVLQFAVDVLKVKHIMVVGHYGCGGVSAAVDGKRRGLVDHWLHPIREVFSCASGRTRCRSPMRAAASIASASSTSSGRCRTSLPTSSCRTPGRAASPSSCTAGSTRSPTGW